MESTKKQIYSLIKNNGGYITYQQLKQAGLSYSILSKMIDDNELLQDDRGIYHLEDFYVDEFFILQYRFPKGVFSLETALWLHGLSLTIPSNPIMSFPYGTNTKLIKEAGIKPVILRKNYGNDIIHFRVSKSQDIMIYDVERTLVECLRPIYKVDIQIIALAFKTYVRERKINYSKIHSYARLFKVEEKVQSYLEVLE